MKLYYNYGNLTDEFKIELIENAIKDDSTIVPPEKIKEWLQSILDEPDED
jgi:hypothetical protein